MQMVPWTFIFSRTRRARQKKRTGCPLRKRDSSRCCACTGRRILLRRLSTARGSRRRSSQLNRFLARGAGVPPLPGPTGWFPADCNDQELKQSEEGTTPKKEIAVRADPQSGGYE